MSEDTPDELDFSELSEKLILSLAKLEQERTELEVRLGDVSKKVASLERMLASMGPLTGSMAFSEFDNISELGITDAVHSVLDRKNKMSAAEIKTAMEKRGFDFSGYSAPDATVRTVLKRLVDADRASVEKDGWKTFYKLPALEIPGAEIDDRDIPF